MENVNIGTDELAGIKIGQYFPQLRFGFMHHLPQDIIHIDNIQIFVRHHHIGAGIIKGNFDALIIIGKANLCPLFSKLLGHILPFDHGTSTLATRVPDRANHKVKFYAREFQMGRDRAGEVLQYTALMIWVLVELVNIAADELVGIQLWQYGFQLGFVGLHHVEHGLVHIDNVIICIRHHDIGLGTAEGALQAIIFFCCNADIRDGFEHMTQFIIVDGFGQGDRGILLCQPVQRMLHDIQLRGKLCAGKP